MSDCQNSFFRLALAGAIPLTYTGLRLSFFSIMRTNLPIFILTSFLFSILFIDGFSQDIPFKKIPEFRSSELGYGCVVDITQDSEGYMWFATLNGLYRYDGYQIKTYQSDNSNPQSLAKNWLNTVYADEEGLIWIGTFGKGMDCLDSKTGLFKHYIHSATNKESICSDTVTVIRADKKGYLWVGTNNGLNYFNIKTGKFTRYQYKEGDPNSISDNQIRVIYTDKKGTTWFGTRSTFKSDFRGKTSGGLNRFNPKTGNFTRYLHNPADENSLIDNRVTAIFEDSRGTFWVGTAGDGLHTMNREKGKFQRHTYDKNHPDKLSRPPVKNSIPYVDDFIAFIKEDATKKIWIGTLTGGINQYDPLTQKTTFIDVTRDSTGGLNSQCFTAFVSRDSVLWISPWLEEMYKVDPYLKSLPFTLFPEPLQGISQENNQTIWLYGQNDLTRKDVKTGIQKKYTHDPKNPNSLSHNNVTYVVRSKNNGLWVATYGGGLDYFDPKTELFTHYKHNAHDKNSLSGDSLDSVHEDGEAIWIGTQRGLDLLNVTTGEFSHFIHNPGDPTNLGNFKIITMHVKDKNTVWMGVWNSRGMSVLNRKTGKIYKHYLEGKGVYSIFKDSQQLIWVASDDGVYRYDAKTDTFSPFIDPHRFTKMGTILAIQEDDKKNLWLCGQTAIYKISPKRDLINIYGSDYGVRGNNIDYFTALSKDKLLFIDNKGYFSFKESEVKNNPVPPQINISAVDIKGDSTNTGSVNQPVAFNQQALTLAYDQNTFSIGFTPIHFAAPEKNKIIFKLDGVDTDWREPGNERKAYYFNLPPGTYIFHLRACNYTGAWSERQLTISITPPWWRTWWAYLLYVLAFGYVVWSFIAYRSRELQRKNRALEEKVHALEEIKDALLQGQKIERRRVAADLHDNLGGMMSAIRLTIEAMDPSKLNQNEKEVYGNVLTMTKQAYDEVRLLSHNLQPAELEKFGLLEALQRLINKLNASQLIRFSLIMNPLQRLDKELEFNLYSICLELANNIVKHSGATEASFELVTKGEQLQLFVTDNGKGFIQNNTSDGMGMKTIQERTEQMGGSLKIHSHPDEGTMFQFIIPLSHASGQT